MSTVKLTIDNREIVADAQSTVLKAARDNGIKIPTLCYLDGVHDTFSCRICVVEVEGARTLLPACVTQVAEGMVVRTNTETVLAARRMIINLLFAEGEHNCYSCEANGDCRLQDIAYDLGIEDQPFKYDHPKDYVYDDSSPMIIRDERKCILCRRCVTACNELVVNKVLNYGYRGSNTRIVCDHDVEMGKSSCVQCGECVQKCPVGALIPKKAKGLARTWEMKKVRTTCPYCGVGCQLELNVKGDRIIKVNGWDALPNREHLCVKGRFGYDFIYSPDRLSYPQIKENGQFRRASWDEALDLIASKFKETIEKYGPDSVGGVSCARSINEDSYAMQKLFRQAFKTNNIDHCARVCHAPTVAGLLATFGTGGMTNSIGEYAKAKMLVCVGTNMTDAHPVASYFAKQGVKNGAKLIVVDPVRRPLADDADVFVQLKVGSDIAFFNGVMHVLIKEDLYDKEFVAKNCENFEALKAKVMEYPPARAAEIAGVREQQVYDVAHMMGEIRPAMVIYTLGITEHSFGSYNVMTLANLQMLLGNMGVECGGVNPQRGQNNVQGACDMGALPNVYPGYQSVSDPAIKEKFEKAWGCQLSDKPGLMIPEMIDALPTKDIRALWIFGENLASSDPDISHVEKCLESAEFLVVQDIFPNETTRFADVILPGAAWSEDEGTYANTERRINLVRKVKEAPGEAKPDWWIFKEVARRMGYEWESNSARDIWDNEMSVMAPAFAGIKYSRLEQDGIQWPCPSLDHPGTQILHVDGKFTCGKGKFQALDWQPAGEVPDSEYPFVLSTGRRLPHYHTRTQTGNCQGLNEIMSEETADISVEDARALNIADGELIRVKSRRGEVKIKAKVTNRVPKGLVWMSFHFRDTNANWLCNGASRDCITKTQEFKSCAVSISKI